MGFLAVLLSVLIILAPGFSLRPTPEAVDAGVTIALGEPARDDSDLPPISGALDPDRPLVVIDAGHGGEDPGATSPFGGRYEKEVTLALARAIRAEIAASARVPVALTPPNNRKTPRTGKRG